MRPSACWRRKESVSGTISAVLSALTCRFLGAFGHSWFRAHHVLLFDYCRNIGVGDMHPIATAIVDTIRDRPEQQYFLTALILVYLPFFNFFLAAFAPVQNLGLTTKVAAPISTVGPAGTHGAFCPCDGCLAVARHPVSFAKCVCCICLSCHNYLAYLF